jgi:hypothetical protein
VLIHLAFLLAQKNSIFSGCIRKKKKRCRVITTTDEVVTRADYVVALDREAPLVLLVLQAVSKLDQPGLQILQDLQDQQVPAKQDPQAQIKQDQQVPAKQDPQAQIKQDQQAQVKPALLVPPVHSKFW